MFTIYSLNLLLRYQRTSKVHFSTKNQSLNLDKVLLLNKVSRLDIERFRKPHLSEDELKKSIKKRGIDYETLIKHHKINKDFQDRVLASFKNFGINVRNVNRFSCTDADIEWCDAIFPVGGDGTFLYAARHIPNRCKPVIGFNSDPSRSEGFLCLPKKYSSDINLALKKLIDGKFKWLFRNRIRITLSGNDSCVPTEIHDVKVYNSKYCDTSEKEKSLHIPNRNKGTQKLPILALNEVFMSEIFAAKVSYFEMRLNNSDKSVKIKSSGLCVCTGTGSTSWNLSINRLSRQDIYEIIKIYLSETKEEASKDYENLVSKISDNFNNRFKFGPEDRILGYTIRDLISLSVWPYPKGLIEPRGFAETIELKSKCLDAAIIIDGGISFPFNEGAVSHLEMHSEDALRTVIISD